ncbi:hypothetical protein ACFO0N_07670 [Halobium salinum]|uniref:DUF7344 domain-containing protein n=1 Tax=Halobium salinum TaxID=1364940 RepID=A0ABD5PAS3_9EURY|nr:hypothetical protein [Halobium salinum]
MVDDMSHGRSASAEVGGGDGSAPARLSPSNVFHVLQNGRRRATLRHLADRGESVEIGALAEHVAAVEEGCTPENVSADARRRVYVSLHQTHLGTLSERGIARYERGTVTPGPALDQFEPYLFERRRLPWKQFVRIGGLGWVMGTLVTLTTARYLPLSTVAVLSLLVGVGAAAATRVTRLVRTSTEPTGER